MINGSAVNKEKTKSSDPKIQAIQEEVDATKKIMEQNIDKILKRGEKLAALKDKTDHLKNESQAFNQNAVKLKNELQFKNVALTMILIGAAIGAGVGLYGILAVGYSWSFLPLTTGLGAGLSYALSLPMKGIFRLYQKMNFATSVTATKPAPLSQEQQKHVVDWLVAAKPFQPHYHALKESVQKSRKEEAAAKRQSTAAIIMPLRSGVKAL